MKNEICAAIGIVGGAIASLLGGWDTALQTLIIFMAIDYITGLIVAGEPGRLEGLVPQGCEPAGGTGGLQAGCCHRVELYSGHRCHCVCMQ